MKHTQLKLWVETLGCLFFEAPKWVEPRKKLEVILGVTKANFFGGITYANESDMKFWGVVYADEQGTGWYCMLSQVEGMMTGFSLLNCTDGGCR